MKKKIFLSITIWIIAIALCTKSIQADKLGEVQTKTDTIYQKENIVFLGDSIFDLYPTEKIFSDFPIVNSGISGNKTTDILDNMEERVYQYNPTKVFIQIGTNDIYWDKSADASNTIVNNIVKIVDNIKENRKKAEIYIISIYPVNNDLPQSVGRKNEEIKEINNKLKEYCATTGGVEYIDAFSKLANEEDQFDLDYTDDGLHPNGLGYAKITEILMKYIYQ